ncbi:flagellar motor switch protein FliM [Sinomonas halotolerans]|uniref:Flagellar motor switch protein FliM n=1 Tax=Sinomonas halotolerans TaxID=1644133 RepID=A0ABU9WZ46_9MICC
MTVSSPAVPYDFRRPTTLAREHSRVLENAFETFARQWATQLTARVRAKSTVTSEHVSLRTYDDYTADLPAATTMVLFALEGTDSRMVVQFPTAASLSWVARMLGASTDTEAEDRKYTPIEERLITGAITETAEALRYSLGSTLPARLAIESISYNSQFAQAAGTGELMIVAAFTIRVGESHCAATIAIPAETVLSGLGAANRVAAAEDAPQNALAQTVLLPLDVGVRLASVSVRPADVLGLAVGDILRLPHPVGRPYDVTVDGLRVATAHPVAARTRAAAQIIAIEED